MGGDSYFRFAHPGWMIVLGFGLYLLTMSAFSPMDIPTMLGPVGRFGQYLGTTYPTGVRSLFWITLLVHIGEAAYSVKLCKTMEGTLMKLGMMSDRRLNAVATTKWCLQTFAFGFSSLIRLSPYRPKTK